MAIFLNNKELAAEIKACQDNSNRVSNTLALMMMKLVHGLSRRGNWRSYTYITDMEADALLQLVRSGRSGIPNVLKFSFAYAERAGTAPNPFAYCTQIATNSFRRFLRVEQTQVNIRDDLLICANMTPSARRQLADDENKSAEPIPIAAKRGRPRKSAG